MPLINEEEATAVFLSEFIHNEKTLISSQQKLVHYTNADAASSILKNKEVWLRNVTTMNDFKEIQHGFECLQNAYLKAVEMGLNNILDTICTGLSAKVYEMIQRGLEQELQKDTYILCLSEHISPEEDNIGRLSMWRAYGSSNSVAFVINTNNFFTDQADNLGIFATKINYYSKEDFESYFNKVIKRIEDSQKILEQFPSHLLERNILIWFMFLCISTKHPGFKEEKEWRVIYCPNILVSKVIEEARVSINCTPQKIYKLPLNGENPGEFTYYRPSASALINRLIIGPTAFPLVLEETFLALLNEAGVPNAEEKLITSDIPMRK